MKTVSADQFKSMYGQGGLDSFNSDDKFSPDTTPSLTDIVGEDISNRADRVGKILNREDTGAVTKGVQVFGQGLGLAADTLEQSAMKVPGVKQVAQAAGEGINWLATSDKSPIKHLGDLIGSSKTLQTITSLYDTDQNFKDTVDAVANIARVGGDIDAAISGANFATNVTNKVISGAKGIATDIAKTADSAVDATSEARGKISAGIMDRVARLDPTATNEFKKISGKTPGQYLVDTGNFGTPQKIIENEAMKFIKSRDAADAGFARLNGTYKNPILEDVLSQLSEKAATVSTQSTRPPYFQRLQELTSRYNKGGLSMSEINEVKRMFEKNVRLGYNKLLNADKIEAATNLDNALRKWQIGKAKQLGFDNIGSINKQTQLSKFIIDKLGKKIVSQSGNDSINLSDWIVLAGANPQSVLGFLTKKFFASKTIQARIAKILSDPALEKEIQANINPTAENTLRGQFPEGAKLELPAGTNKTVQDNTPIYLGGESTIEKPAEKIMNQSMIKTPSTREQLRKQGIKSAKPYTNNTTASNKKQIKQK